jgi:hypothetical protein
MLALAAYYLSVPFFVAFDRHACAQDYGYGVLDALMF